MRVVLLGCGPSLTEEDVAACRDTYTIAINNAVDLAPWADVAYGADYHWWERLGGLPDFQGRRVSMAPFNKTRYPAVRVYEQGPLTGLSEDRTRLAHGRNSGYSAINLAVHLGATTIILLGYDFGPSGDRHHFHDPHPGDAHPAYDRWRPYFATLSEPLTGRGVTVFNASRHTTLTVFPRVSLPEALHVPTDVDRRSDVPARTLSA